MSISAFKIINSYAKRWKALDEFAVFCARLLPYLLGILLIVFAFLENNVSLLLFPVLSGLLSRFVITQTISFLYKKQRPANLPGTNVLIPVPRAPAFPSGHASFFFGISFLLFFYNVPLAIIFLICSTINSLARVFCGVHWFGDVIGGVLSGAIASIIIYLLIK